MKKLHYFSALCAGVVLASASAQAQLLDLGDGELSEVNGQAGISMSSSLSLSPNTKDTRCLGGCGARLAIQPNKSTGWIVMDNFRGVFSFEGLTLDIVTINSGYDGDGAAFNNKALRLSLVDAHTDNLQYTLAGANQPKPGAGLQQTDLLTYKANGGGQLTGNLYIFGSPPR